MRRFTVCDRHTVADIGLEIEGDSLEELFLAATEGLYHLISGGIRKVPISGEKKSIQFEACDTDQLLIDWLSELIYQFDGCHKQIHIEHIKINPEKPCKLEARIIRNDLEPDVLQTGHDIKAVTYYKLKIINENGVFSTPVVFDL